MSVGNKKIKEYEIDSFEKLINVANRDNIQSLSNDLFVQTYPSKS